MMKKVRLTQWLHENKNIEKCSYIRQKFIEKFGPITNENRACYYAYICGYREFTRNIEHRMKKEVKGMGIYLVDWESELEEQE